MTEFDYKEKRFEADIEAWLLAEGGYAQGDPAAFDKKLGLDVGTLLGFLKESQPKEWGRYAKMAGAGAEREIVARFCRAVHTEGLLRVLRQGFMDRGVRFRAVFWKPETSINETGRRQYESNVFHCTRQLHYSPNNGNSIDMVLFVNGIPVVSLELKCQFTGQNAGNAITQYRFDRAGKEALFTHNERVLVHFAVDLEQVFMTTRLEGAKTAFLPFNQGSNGAGNVGGKGNPANPSGYMTSYLWEKVLCRERLLELLQKYLHADAASGRIIFPRYHQLDVVTKLLADVRARGAGHHYLIQHSAGSGKSNSIAWLAHRLSGLHDRADNKIFRSVVIVTDRRVLDSQLQDTVYSFDHVDGVVQKIDTDAKQLKDAIESGTPIIITTLQKFPVIYQEVSSAGNRFAVIVDEAHSSQTGEAARKLKSALADTEEALREYAEWEGGEERRRGDAQDKLLNELAGHGRHGNLSFFAFTATPKDKTLQMFGERGADGRYRPFHIYSMRQAIEEGFIMDVLRNYMTYNVYYRIAKRIPDDPELGSAEGLKAIRRFQSLHPHNLAQKTAVMLEHFRSVTSHKMGGRAKAMVVTASRLHAVRYCREFRRQIEANGYQGIHVLVAFSGEVRDVDAVYTEVDLNRKPNGDIVSEKALPEVFRHGDYHILIVAEKYQTGFDEPLLHTMFVDKPLSGVKAVQTLSRLNRTAKGKQDTFVLDFVNTGEDIRKAFEPYYEGAFLDEPTDPNVVYDLYSTLENMRVTRRGEIDRFAGIFFASAPQDPMALGRLQGELLPALERYRGLPEEEQDRFRSTLGRFNRIYAFITQVCRLFDKELHRFSVYARFLSMQLPAYHGAAVDVDDKVLLEFYRLEKDFEGGIALEPSGGGMRPITGDAGRAHRKTDPLSKLIAEINARFGTDFTEMDKVLLQMEEECVRDEKWKACAQNNDMATFAALFHRDFPAIAVNRYKMNDAFFIKIFQEPEMLAMVEKTLASVLYQRLADMDHLSQTEEFGMLEAAESEAPY